MRRLALSVCLIVLAPVALSAQPAPPEGEVQGAKPNANPCSDEVSAALKKLRTSAWFRMNTRMITENGPMAMQVEYVLPDRMHQTVTSLLTQKTSEMILVGKDGWSRQGTDAWRPLPNNVAQQLKNQIDENVLQQQTDIGSYACKGRTQFEGRDVMSYKLDNEPAKGETQSQNQAFRMFYVDALTGLPVSNAILAPGHEEKPIFKTTYEFPIDLKVDPPADIAKDAPPASDKPAAGQTPPASPAPNK